MYALVSWDYGEKLGKLESWKLYELQAGIAMSWKLEAGAAARS